VVWGLNWRVSAVVFALVPNVPVGGKLCLKLMSISTYSLLSFLLPSNPPIDPKCSHGHGHAAD